MTKLRTYIFIAFILGLSITTPANAAVEHLNLPVCNLAIYPYNPTQPELQREAGTPFLNFLSETICKTRTPYGQAYKQPVTKAENPSQNTPDIEQKSVPYAQHYHYYVNNALEDNYYYRSLIDKFEIKLQTDTLNNTEKLAVQCVTPAPGSFSGSAADLADCNGTVNDESFYGGVSVNYDSNSGVITWEFGTVNKNKRPNMWGNNDSNPADSDNFDETLQSVFGLNATLSDSNSLYRKFTPSVVLKTKNNSSEAWSATTTSRILIRNYAILKSSFNLISDYTQKFGATCTTANDYTKWCPVSTPSGQGFATVQQGNSGQQQWFWFPIGSVVSVWNKPTPAPLACADLQWDGPFWKMTAFGKYIESSQNVNALLSKEEALMKFRTIYQTGTAPKRPIEYRWVSFKGEQNRPNWFINDDSLFLIDQVYKGLTTGFSPFLINNLPGKVLTIAHAAPSVKNNATGSTAGVQTINSGVNNPPSAQFSGSGATNPGITEVLLMLGKFSDESTSPLLMNPLIDDDNQVHYTGGTAGVTLGVQAFYTDGLNIPGQGAMVPSLGGTQQKAEKCHLELTIQDKPNVPALCQQLIVKFFENGVQVAKENLVAGKTYNVQIDQANSKKTDGSSISKYTWTLSNTKSDISGAISLDPTSSGSCSKGLNDLTCKYNYTPRANDKITFLADPHDNVAACKVEQIIPEVPVVPICKDLNLTTLGLIGGEIPVNTTISLSADPRDTNDAPRNPVVYEAKGTGTFAPVAGNPLNCPRRSNNFSASSECKYTFQANSVNSGDQLTVKVQADDGVPACTATFPIVKTPVTPICKDLNLNILGLVSGQIPVNTTISLSTDPRDTNNNPRQPVVYEKTGAGTFTPVTGNSLTCPPRSSRNFEAPSECKYTFSAATAVPGDNLSVKVKQDDGVPACSATFPVVETPKDEEICLALNLQVNGAYTLNPLLTPGVGYSLQTAPITTKGNPVPMVEWTENGSGQLIGNAGNPAICPAAINNGSVVTPAFCRYIYSSPLGATDTDGFSVRAVPDNNVTACSARAQKYVPPVVKPYCLYLDLDYYPEPFNPLNPSGSGMNAVVVMSDGSKYNDRVRFTSTNGAGTFSGGLSAISSAPYDLRSLTDERNNTTTVNFSGGNSDSGINVLLSDTGVIQTAACQRQLRPTPKPPQVCTEPPRITRNGNTFTTPVGNSNEYCWSITGTGNPLFNNGRNTATGRTVVLNSTYTDFDLRVEDCNPQFRNFCSDTYKVEGTPKIEKKIGKAIQVGYGTKITYSTKGNPASFNEAVKYQLTYSPADYAGGNLTASIYDPAFTGTINGSKTKIAKDGKTSQVPGGDITIDLNSIEVSSASKTYAKCSSGFTVLDACYEINNSSPVAGFGTLTIHGIQSAEAINIKYNGTLRSTISTKDCQDGSACNEKVINQSFVTDMKYCVATISNGKPDYTCTTVSKPYICTDIQYIDNTGKVIIVKPCRSDNYTIFSNLTSAELVCQYFLTRASGDIFLEDELKYGIDVSKCYPFKNISSTITKPAKPIPPSAPKTGAAQIVSIDHEICSSGQSDFAKFTGTDKQKTALKELFGADISKLSSQICEVGLVPGSDWDKTSINKAISQNIGKLTRWDDGYNTLGNQINSSNLDSIIKQGRVYYYKGTSPNDTVTIDELNIPEGSGALTIIVENADLQINKNIQYKNFGGNIAQNAKEISSLGVIVINGNMYVDQDVEKLAGAYFVQRTETENYTVGNIFSGHRGALAESEKQLTINGSIYGNIGPLFEMRNAAGDISMDEGAITIRYDQRIIQNPPAGLSEILGSFNQSQIAQ